MPCSSALGGNTTERHFLSIEQASRPTKSSIEQSLQAYEKGVAALFLNNNYIEELHQMSLTNTMGPNLLEKSGRFKTLRPWTMSQAPAHKSSVGPPRQSPRLRIEHIAAAEGLDLSQNVAKASAKQQNVIKESIPLFLGTATPLRTTGLTPVSTLRNSGLRHLNLTNKKEPGTPLVPPANQVDNGSQGDMPQPRNINHDPAFLIPNQQPPTSSEQTGIAILLQ